MKKTIDISREEILHTIRRMPILRCVACGCLLPVLAVTLHRVLSAWNGAEQLLAYGTIGVAVVSCVLLWVVKRRVTFGWIDTCVLLWFAYMTGRAWMGGDYPCASFGLKMVLAGFLYLSLRLLFSTRLVAGGMLSLLIIVMACCEAYMGMDQLISGSSHHARYLITGSFFNPGPYAAYLAIGIAVGCQWMCELGDRKVARIKVSNLLLGAVLFCAVVLPATWSRAAFVALAVCLAIIYWKYWKRYWVWATLAVLASFMLFYLLKQGSADGRGFIFRMSALCVADHPLWGSGIGSFFHQYGEKVAQVCREGGFHDMASAEVIDYAFDDLMLVAVEQGLVGLSLVLGLLVMTAVILWRSSRPLFMGMLSMVLVSLFSYPFEMLPYQILGVAMVAFAASQSAQGDGVSGGLILRPLTMTIVVAAGAAVTARAIDERYEANRDYERVGNGGNDSYFNNLYYEILPLMNDNPRYLFAFGKMLRNQGRWNDSNDMLSRGAMLSNDPMFHVLMSENYVSLGDSTRAEQTLWHACHMVPNRMYPLYCLAKLYEAQGENEKMKQTSRRLLKMDVKITSPATREMQAYARKLLYSK